MHHTMTFCLVKIHRYFRWQYCETWIHYTRNSLRIVLRYTRYMFRMKWRSLIKNKMFANVLFSKTKTNWFRSGWASQYSVILDLSDIDFVSKLLLRIMEKLLCTALSIFFCSAFVHALNLSYNLLIKMCYVLSEIIRKHALKVIPN